MAEGDTLLVPVDFSSHARAAALRACDLARACDGRVRLIHGIDGVVERFEEKLESWCADLSLRGASISALVESQDPVELIERESLGQNVLLVVMGMHEFHEVGRLFLGSVADRALRATRVPIMLVKENEREADVRIRRILLATDFSPASEDALRLAILWARRLGADVEVLHAIQDGETEASYRRPRDSVTRSAHQRANALEALRSILMRIAAAGVRAVADLTYGVPSIEIVKHAARSRADLVVMGKRGRSSTGTRMAGSVTERVIRHVKCSVLVAPEARRGELATSF